MGTFGESFKRELGKNTAKWVSNKIVGDKWSTPHKLIIEKEEIKKEREKIQRYKERERDYEKEQRRSERENERQQRLEELEEQKNIKEAEKQASIDEKERLLEEQREQILENKKELEEFNDYLLAIQSFHKICADDFNWVINAIKYRFRWILGEKVPQIIYMDKYNNFDELKEYYSVWKAFTNNGEIFNKDFSDEEQIFRKKQWDIDILKSFINNNSDISNTLKNKYDIQNINESEITELTKRIRSEINNINTEINNIKNNIEELEEDKNSIEDEIKKHKRSNVFSKILSNKQNEENESAIENYENKIEKIKIKNEYDALSTIVANINYYYKTIESIDNLWQVAKEEFDALYSEYIIATGVLENDNDAYNYAINLYNPFDFADEIGTYISYDFNSSIPQINITVKGKDVIPENEKYIVRDKEIKERPIPKNKFNEIYQDYVCSAVIRLAREFFAFFPINDVIINANGEIFNSSTGHNDDAIILSVYFPYDELQKLNFSLIDPSDSIRNFQHTMNFNKTTGFTAVSQLEISKINRTTFQNDKRKYFSEKPTTEIELREKTTEKEETRNEEIFNSIDTLNSKLDLLDYKIPTVELIDELFEEAARIIVTNQQGSTTLLKRELKIDYSRVSRIIDQLEAAGIIGAFGGSKPREVYFKDIESLNKHLKK